MYLVDLPGYGYAKTSASEKEKWGKMIENYLHTSKKLQAVFLLIDIRHDPSANDKMMYDWMVYQGFTPIIIATKLDKIKRSQIQKNVKAIREGLKVSGYGDDRFRYLVAQVALCVALQLLQNDSADLLGGVGLAVNVDFVIGAHVALDGSDGALRIGDGLALCHIAHHALAVLAERHHGRVVRAPSALGITTASPPSITLTQLFVVPKSIPIILPIIISSCILSNSYI